MWSIQQNNNIQKGIECGWIAWDGLFFCYFPKADLIYVYIYLIVQEFYKRFFLSSKNLYRKRKIGLPLFLWLWRTLKFMRILAKKTLLFIQWVIFKFFYDVPMILIYQGINLYYEIISWFFGIPCSFSFIIHT